MNTFLQRAAALEKLFLPIIHDCRYFNFPLLQETLRSLIRSKFLPSIFTDSLADQNHQCFTQLKGGQSDLPQQQTAAETPNRRPASTLTQHRAHAQPLQ